MPTAVRDALADPGHYVMFSAVNTWEIAIKKSLGKPGFDFGPDDVLQGARATGFVELPVTAEHAARVLTPKPLQQDPFDRLLIAQALCEPARLLTADRAVSRYAAPIDFMAPQ